MPVIEQKTTNKNKVDFDLNRLDKSKTTIFSKYPKKHALTLEQAVRKMTALPARALRLRHKGVIAEGMDADLCVFDPAQLRENGDYRCPCRMASGLDAVLVAGQPAVIHDTLTGAHAGTVIRRELI